MDVMKFGLKHYKKYSFLWLLCLCFGQIITLCGLLLPKITQLIVDYNLNYDAERVVTGSNPFHFLVDGRFGSPETWTLFLTLCIAFILVLAIRHVFAYTRYNVSHWYGVKFENILRDMTFRKLLSQSNVILSRYNSGDLLTILNNDTIMFKELFTFTIPFIIDKIVLIIFATVLLFGVNPYLAIVPFAISPVLIVTCILYIRRARTVSTKIRDCTADLSMRVQENINGVRIVRSLAREDTETEKFDKVNDSFRSAFFEHTDMWTKYGFIFNFIRIATYLASVTIGTVLAIQNKISIGDFVAFTAYVMLIMDAITQFVNLIFQTQQFLVSGRRIYNFVMTEDVIKNAENAVTLTEKPEITIRDMTIVMDDQTVLSHVNMDIPYGKKIGIMGNTGSGKSVLLKSLIRTFDPYAGSICVNGINIKNIDLENLRQQFGYVFQDVFLFSNTIDANIAYYDVDAPHEKVVECAKIAKAHDFILQTENGYDTIVGENGIGLSGGQKQRISIARALLKNAPILIMDSATSALDHETEVELMHDILEYNREATMLIATHRASSVMNCDEIIYLDGGEIAERGTHDDLMALDGRYARVFKAQSANYAEEEGTNG